MRPCPKCGAAIGNGVLICPSCDYANDESFRETLSDEQNNGDLRESDSFESGFWGEYFILISGMILFSLILGASRLYFGEAGWSIGLAVSFALFSIFRILLFL